MEKIFYTNKIAFLSSEHAIQYVLERFFNLKKQAILRNKNGKPYLQDESLFFSVSHTKDLLFIAVSDKNIGIDVENVYREVNYLPILKKFTQKEQQAILTKHDFLTLWTIKESVIKWLSGSIALDLTKIHYENEKIFYNENPLNVTITKRFLNDFLIAICCESDFENAELVFFP